MNADEEEWIQYALMEAERKRCISKILKLDCKDAVPKGNNYVSDIYRLTIKVITNSGEIEDRSAIYKILPISENKFKNAKEMGFFKFEAMMYMDTLNLMRKLQESKEPGSEPLWAQFYGAKGNYDGFLMEDLSVQGYVMANRRMGFDFEHVSFCLKNLAKFHALASVLLEKGSLPENEYFKGLFFFQDLSKAQSFCKMVYPIFANAIEEFWPSEWHSYVEGVRNLHDTLVPKVVEIMQDKENIFMTLNHGDFWLNNVMLKYNSSGSPIDIRFVDYQFCYKNSPCYDIQFLFSTSLRLEFFDRKLELLRIYHKSLVQNLKLFDYKKPVPTFEELEVDFEKTRYFGYCISLAMRPRMMNPPVHELAERYNGNAEDKWGLNFRYDGEDVLRILRHVLLEMRKRELL